MFKRIMSKIQKLLVKEIVLVDSENIGYQIPLKIPNNTQIYLFISDPYIGDKMRSYKNNKNIKLINIYQIRKQCVAKNIMDFCIVAELTHLLSIVTKRTRLVICSKDRGYDASIAYLKQNYKNYQIERYPGSLCSYYHTGNEDYLAILESSNEQLKNKILSCSNMHSLKAILTKKEKKAFVIKEHINLIGMVKTAIELDVYEMTYYVFYNGRYINTYKTRKEAQEKYQECIQKLHEKYDKYGNRERFLKSKELQIRQYVEEAALQNVPLEECLIYHLGDEQGHLVYGQYVS